METNDTLIESITKLADSKEFKKKWMPNVFYPPRIDEATTELVLRAAIYLLVEEKVKK